MKHYRNVFLSVFFGATLFLLLISAGILRFGGVGPLIAYINGESVYLTPRLLDLGPCEAGSEAVAAFRLQNLSSKEIPVVGERSSCNCAFSEQIPIVAEPNRLPILPKMSQIFTTFQRFLEKLKNIVDNGNHCGYNRSQLLDRWRNSNS